MIKRKRHIFHCLLSSGSVRVSGAEHGIWGNRIQREPRNGRLVWKVSDQVLDDRLDDMMIKQRQGTEIRSMENPSLFSNLNSELVVVL